MGHRTKFFLLGVACFAAAFGLYSYASAKTERYWSVCDEVFRYDHCSKAEMPGLGVVLAPFPLAFGGIVMLVFAIVVPNTGRAVDPSNYRPSDLAAVIVTAAIAVVTLGVMFGGFIGLLVGSAVAVHRRTQATEASPSGP